MDMTLIDYVSGGLAAVFLTDPLFSIAGIPVSTTLVMVFCGLLAGIVVGAIPGLNGPFAMAVALPILISTFGFTASALLPTLGFLIGIMKGSTLGGAVPAILFNTPGTPDAVMTTLDGYPMARKGQGSKALRVAHFSCVSGDTFSDIVLITTAPFLAVLVERYLGFPEKAALIVLSMAFIAAVVGSSVLKGLLSAVFGMFVASVGTGEDTAPRLTFGVLDLAQGFSVEAVVLGVLILGEIFTSIEDLAWRRRNNQVLPSIRDEGDQHLSWAERLRLLPVIGRSAAIGSMIGALPGIGTTLAATLGYAIGKRRHKGPGEFGDGIPEGVAATEGANSAVSGSNLIPVLSLGIPGNIAAVFILLAMESIGGLNPGPNVFRMTPGEMNPELVMVIGLFVLMMLANLLNWTLGGAFMRRIGILQHIPAAMMMPVVLLVTLTAVYIQDAHMSSIYMALGFGFVGYLMRKLDISVLPFVIAFILADDFERLIRQGFAASGGDPWFLFASPVSIAFLVGAILVATVLSRNPVGKAVIRHAD
ncbi:tripartite tricarboxylate transporter permease [Marinobacterium rhizophilum]|uniref:Tripartite tricarboxylate transporter permease n=1 Tax=Marinobacterium rhizophilum TaxID=420402 RepID=A0ABY5HPF7_9GAMM|nr:tripartite tricarboxylate transporter permease [Marinobacterium rhizophilum]UTW13112.1 tripartite tricarboxylate transporter permease [Marinobacterium rhizophilum]